jgi:hypothetical protein
LNFICVNHVRIALLHSSPSEPLSSQLTAQSANIQLPNIRERKKRFRFCEISTNLSRPSSQQVNEHLIFTQQRRSRDFALMTFSFKAPFKSFIDLSVESFDIETSHSTIQLALLLICQLRFQNGYQTESLSSHLIARWQSLERQTFLQR